MDDISRHYQMAEAVKNCTVEIVENEYWVCKNIGGRNVVDIPKVNIKRTGQNKGSISLRFWWKHLSRGSRKGSLKFTVTRTYSGMEASE